MTVPMQDEMLLGATTWRGDVEGVRYMLTHHGHIRGDEYIGARAMPGIWCYYLLIPEQMFPDRWADFACVRKPSGFGEPGPAWDHDWFDSEITWSSSEPYWDHITSRQWDAAKVGCDYAHLYQMEQGYLDTYASVMLDAQTTARAFITANPDRRLMSEYSNRWGKREDFYIATNGKRVHKEDKPNWAGWEPRV